MTATDAHTAESGDELDATTLPLPLARVLLRFVEESPEVCRRHQFYTLLQNQLMPLLPHTVAVCGAYDRRRRDLVFDVFNSVVLPPWLQVQLARADSPLLARLLQAWIDGAGEPLTLPLQGRPADAIDAEVAALRDAGVQRLLVHGVSRPERQHEVSGFYLLGGPLPGGDVEEHRLMRLVVHALHAAYLRTVDVEREVGVTQPVRLAQPVEARSGSPARITPRETQILSWVRDGKNNQQIGEALGISALTVKNHIQKILRKLGASNRAHAVALAMQLRLLDEGKARS
jgi:transcriptional regulator EpsA